MASNVHSKWSVAESITVVESLGKAKGRAIALRLSICGGSCGVDPRGVGDLVVYRGDLPHADVSYMDGNLRLQASVNVDGMLHDEGVVESVAGAFFSRCDHCFKRCDSKLVLLNHYRACNDYPRKAESSASANATTRALSAKKISATLAKKKVV
ncbi:hypothetical protein JG687_00017098 [Phytophthora cactorum]|uniref:Uncharacterized protein n=1 Tax=Phytophthora cactorum TaxID=29920 RepID=A0A8T1TS58_9STRA|nr:hypothetical protein JG687_00017098 [Phytophthora cactorum]